MSENPVENKKRIIFIGGELSPFMELSLFSVTLNELLILALEHNYEVRCILPKWGNINERRYRLHEVVRLSGLNVRVENTDYTLEIKVASLPRVRLQVYFLGNEKLFPKRFDIYKNEHGDWSENNGTRKAFFCRATLQIMRKFGWPPDIIFCSHWISSLLPLYIKKIYKNDAIFQRSKIISTLSEPQFRNKIEREFLKKAIIDDRMNEEDLSIIKGLKFNDFQKAAMEYADAVVLTDKKVSKSLITKLQESDKEVIDFNQDSDLMEYIKLFEILA